MNLRRLIIREIIHRKVSFILGLGSIIAAVSCLTATMILMRGHEIQTQTRTTQLKNDIKKTALKVGFNVFVLPEGVKSKDLYAPDLGGHTMPQEYVNKLANAEVITIDHLLPTLTAPVFWQEQKTQIILTGIHGEVAVSGKKRKRPLIQPVEPGHMVLGYNVHKNTGIKAKDTVTLMGREFKITGVNIERGSVDDNTVWIDLTEAQAMLNKPGRISAIQAINCLAEKCHPDDKGNIPGVSSEITAVLPATQVRIDLSKALPRLEMRLRAIKEDQESQKELEQFASVMIPLVIGAAGIWIGLLALMNVRERRAEIGILRALGLGGGGIMKIFLGRAVFIGLIGALVGCGFGVGIGARLGAVELGQLIDPVMLLGILIGAPVLVAISSWLPAMLAAQQDPASILCQE